MLRLVKNEAVAATAAMDRVRAEVGSWPGVGTGVGLMPGSIEFDHRGRVLGSVYPVPGGMPAADLIVPPAVGDALIAQRRARRHPLVPAPGWISVMLETEADVAHAIALFRDNYDRSGRPLRLV